MSLVYKISSGSISNGEAVIGHGYSGQPQCKNDPSKCDLHDIGPIPPGRYDIGSPRDTATHGPFVMPLTPHPENEMHGRSAFLIHGDSVTHPGTASHGCIILSRALRESVWASGIRELLVEV